jgi:hypothetical protein
MGYLKGKLARKPNPETSVGANTSGHEAIVLAPSSWTKIGFASMSGGRARKLKIPMPPKKLVQIDK